LDAVRDPGVAAELAAEALRRVNRFTLVAPARGVSGWESVSDLYRILGELRVFAERIPQAFDQLGRHLERPANQGSAYKSDSGTSESSESLVATAVAALNYAERDVRQVGINLSSAQSAVAHLYA